MPEELLNVIEVRVRKIVLLLPEYTPSIVSIGDPRILQTKPGANRGNFRIIIQGASLVNVGGETSYGYQIATWEMPITLYGMWGPNIKASYDAHRSERDRVLLHLMRYPSLGGLEDITGARIYSASEPQLWELESGNWVSSTMRMRITQRFVVEPLMDLL